EIMDNIDEGLKNIQRAGELREEQIEALRVWAETRIENCQKENTRLQASVTALEHHLEHGDMDANKAIKKDLEDEFKVHGKQERNAARAELHTGYLNIWRGENARERRAYNKALTDYAKAIEAKIEE
ncbi:hypothetical protein LCGC14_1864750, partial [marine sediment metagenome]